MGSSLTDNYGVAAMKHRRKDLNYVKWQIIPSSLFLNPKLLSHTEENNNRDPVIVGYSEILWSEAHFSPYNLILHTQSKRTILYYTNLTSKRFLREESSFDKISLYFWICDARASEITVQYSMEKYNSCYVTRISHQR